ncbi:MAG TPA: LytTR family DNA-binding domain-containing protein, partial [Ferruginibacter sp.]|nr:LytTR family DNA-binding domain-containing protein [Ferruginibacter sp.]
IMEVEPDSTVIGSLDSVAHAIDWLNNNESPDLIFSDIQLSDGLSFEIFKSVELRCPVIFVTAYDQYALNAFKVNSIDYLLKPVKKDELQSALAKFKKITPSPLSPSLDIEKLLMAYGGQQDNYKKRFVVKYGEHIKTITTDEIVYFYTEDKINFLTTKEGRRFTIDFNLDTLDSMLDPKVFFRINRQFIISIHSIAEMFSYSKSRVLIKLNPPSRHETIVSTERSSAFKTWLGDGA